MASAIDASKPVSGTPTTSSVRDNFDFTEKELNELMRITEDNVTAGGSADALTATFVETVVLAEGVIVCVKATAANTTTTPTLNADSTGAFVITKQAGEALSAGDIAGAGHYCLFKYNATSAKWVLLNPKVSTDASTLGGVAAANYARTDTAETFANDVTVEGTLASDDLGGVERPVGFNVAAPSVQDSAYTLVLSDAGKGILHTNSTAYAWTIPPNSSVAFPLGTVVQLVNFGSGNITVTRGVGVTLRRFDGSGTTVADADVTLSGGSVCTIFKYTSDVWFIWGNGLA